MEECIFCKIITKKIKSEIILEKDDCIVIKDIYPKAAIHLLIIPKKHIENIKTITYDDEKLLAEILFTAQELSRTIPHASDFKIIINNGHNAGQQVFHLHAHFLVGLIHKELI